MFANSDFNAPATPIGSVRRRRLASLSLARTSARSRPSAAARSARTRFSKSPVSSLSSSSPTGMLPNSDPLSSAGAGADGFGVGVAGLAAAPPPNGLSLPNMLFPPPASDAGFAGAGSGVAGAGSPPKGLSPASAGAAAFSASAGAVGVSVSAGAAGLVVDPPNGFSFSSPGSAEAGGSLNGSSPAGAGVAGLAVVGSSPKGLESPVANGSADLASPSLGSSVGAAPKISSKEPCGFCTTRRFALIRSRLCA